MLAGKNRNPVRSDLVGSVSISCDPVGTDNDGANISRLQEVADHVVCDQREGNAILMKFPGSESRTLEIRPRFGDEQFELGTGFDPHANHAEGGANSTCGERAGIALSHHTAGFWHEL